MALLVAVTTLSCVEIYEPNAPDPNQPPSTTLANIPADHDTVGALSMLSWDGHDDDGYVVAFEYQYTTVPVGLSPSDSIVHEWIRVETHSEVISFSSPGDVNRQVFQVRAIDNSGNIDPNPATRIFYTYRTTTPSTRILSPANESEFFAVEKTSYWFPGVVVTVSGSDQDGSVIEYGWSVDDGPLTWVEARDSVITVLPQDFKQPLTGPHTFTVKSKDNTLLVDPVGASIRISLVQPTFLKDILILDDTREDVSLRNVSDAAVDSFYRAIFSDGNALSIDDRDMKTRAFPSRRILGDYKLVIWHHDDSKPPFYLSNDVAINTIQDYLHVGGDLILSGVRLWEHWLPPADPILGLPHPIPFDEGSFVRDYLHIPSGELSNIVGSFDGATGVGEFTDVAIDPSKMNPDFPQFGKPHYVGVVVEKGSFTREILRFKGTDQYAGGLPCAIRYYGDTFDIVYVGFPIWSLASGDATTLAQQLLRSIGY